GTVPVFSGLKKDPMKSGLSAQQEEDLRVVVGYAAIMRNHANRSRWAGPYFDGKTSDDFIERLTRLAKDAPDSNRRASFEKLADQVAGLQLSFFLPYRTGRKILMFSLLVLALYGALTGQLWYTAFLIPTLAFSPRV